MNDVLKSALEQLLGPAEPTVLTALPPLALGGGADVLSFRSPPGGGVALATFGLSEPGSPQRTRGLRYELLMFADTLEPRIPELLSRLGAATASRAFGSGHTVPVPDVDGLDGLLFLEEPRSLGWKVGGETRALLVAVGLTAEELEAARRFGSRLLERALVRGGIGNRTRFSRPTSPALQATLDGRPGRILEGRSAAMDGVLLAMRNGDETRIEVLRDAIGPSDVPLALALWSELDDWTDRDLLLAAFTDRDEAELRPIWEAMLAHPDIRPETLAHGNVALALERLGRGTFVDWYRDHEGMLAELAR